MIAEILKPGPLTTVQDGGRPGLLSKGIPPAGAQDAYCLRAANALVGNRVGPPPLSLGDPGDAGLEFLLQGPRLRFDADAVIAVTGAEVTPKVDGEAVPTWEPVTVPAGVTLDAGMARQGARGYVAVRGGVDVAPFLGSRSTYLVGAVGGHEGRALAKGDRLPVGDAGDRPPARTGQAFPPELRPRFESPQRIRVMHGPQADLFDDESVERFFAAEWTLSPVANRMGFRFTGPTLTFKERPDYLARDAGSNPSNIVDDVTPLGGIQAPDGAALILMGVEHPTAGGYAKIATVITADLGLAGQVRPGGTVVFEPVTAEEALEADALQTRSLSLATEEPVA